MNCRELAFEVVKGLGVTNARNNVFALSVNQKIAIRFVFTRCCVAGETHACTRVVIAVSKHHRLYVDRSA